MRSGEHNMGVYTCFLLTTGLIVSTKPKLKRNRRYRPAGIMPACILFAIFEKIFRTGQKLRKIETYWW